MAILLAVLILLCRLSIASPPERIPEHLYQEFTLNDTVKVVLHYKDDSTPPQEGLIYDINTVERLKQKALNKESAYYGPTDEFLYAALDQYAPFIKNKKIGIIGSTTPWYESIILSYGGHPVSIDYNKIISEHPDIRTLTVEEFSQNPETFDTILSISSIEHSGLGRYGDPINPYGDIEAMIEAKKMLNPGGLLLLAVPTGLDYLFWNAHRVYGKNRLSLLLKGWKILNTFGGLNLEQFSDGYHQPVLVLAPEGENGYVTAHLNGQLGNQMFQIAATIAYALEHNCKAIFPYISTAMGGQTNGQHIFHRLDTTPFPDQEKHIYQENQFTHYTIYSPIPFKKGEFIFLDGFFQTPKYFNRYSEYIRHLFAPSKTILNEIQSKYGDLLKEPTVALHIRTFIPDQRDPNQTIGTRGWKYFQQAIDHFPDECIFLIFSDDMNWTKQNFPFINRRIKFIEGNPYWIDFYLMSLCQHQILPPESTFSWWAAWLNTNPGKIVIAPNTWAGRLDAEIIPPEWIKIPIEQP